MKQYYQKAKFLLLMCLSFAIIVSLVSITHFGLASLENRTSMEPRELNNTALTNDTNIVLIHGTVRDGSIWSKVIPILTNAGHKVIAEQLPLHSPEDDIDTVKRAVEQLGGPTILVRHSYGEEVITNAGYNNPNITGLVCLAAIAPDEGETGNAFFEKLPEKYLKTFSEGITTDSAEFMYFNPDKFRESFAQDVDPAEANIIMAIVQKPINQSFGTEKSGPPAWKQLPTWYQVSENDRLIPPDIQRLYAERMNAITLTKLQSYVTCIRSS
jgi:pimeloyl-ACP methyl ester carboxylesterase